MLLYNFHMSLFSLFHVFIYVMSISVKFRLSTDSLSAVLYQISTLNTPDVLHIIRKEETSKPNTYIKNAKYYQNHHETAKIAVSVQITKPNPPIRPPGFCTGPLRFGAVANLSRGMPQVPAYTQFDLEPRRKSNAGGKFGGSLHPLLDSVQKI